MFHPPAPPPLLTPDFRLHLYAAAASHGHSCPCPSRPIHPLPYPPYISPQTGHSLRSLSLLACLTVRASFPAIHTLLPLRLLALNAHSLHLHLFSFVHRTSSVPHHFRIRAYRPRPTTCFRSVLTAPVFLLPPRRLHSPRRPVSAFRAPRCRVCSRGFQ